jgi:NitT/TauT family transport system substrate-binding protein
LEGSVVQNRSLFLSSSFSAAAVAAFSESADAQTPPLALRVAANANDTYAAAYYAQDMGFFTRAGLNVDLQTIANGAAITAAVTGGTIDVGVAVPVTLANAHLRGIPVVIIAAGSVSTASIPATRLCVLETSDIKTAKDLEGKTIALNALGVGLDISLDAYLVRNGADYTKVKLVEVPFTEMGLALDRHSVDAAVITEPSYTLISRQTKIKMMTNVSAGIGTDYINSCWFTTREFARTHPDHIRRFVRAIYDAQRWGNTHHDESGVILAKYSKLDVSLAHTMLRAQYAERLRAQDVQPFLDAAVKFGGLPSPVSAASFIYQP